MRFGLEELEISIIGLFVGCSVPHNPRYAVLWFVAAFVHFHNMFQETKQ